MLTRMEPVATSKSLLTLGTSACADAHKWRQYICGGRDRIALVNRRLTKVNNINQTRENRQRPNVAPLRQPSGFDASMRQHGVVFGGPQNTPMIYPNIRFSRSF